MARKSVYTKEWWNAAFQGGVYPLTQLAALKDQVGLTRREVQGIKKLLNLPKGSKILDLGCGVGRHSLGLARHSYDVTGVDISNTFLRYARARARKMKLQVNFIRKDMRLLSFKGQFDAAINIFTSFGYFPQKSDDLRVARKVCKCLKPGGKFLLEIFNGTKIQKLLVNANSNREPVRRWYEFADRSLLLEHPSYSKRLGGTVTRWIYITKGKRKEVTSFTRAYSKSSLVHLLKNAGFRQVTVYGDLECSRYYPHKSNRLVAVATK